jgi:hypothetical protein
VKERPILFSAPIEEWRAVRGFEGRYEVSNLGRVRTLSAYRPSYHLKVLTPYVQNRGYRYVVLRGAGTQKKTVAVHRLVLDAFVGPRPAGHECAHGNGDPSDNRLENLRWATSAQNHQDRRRHGRVPAGEDNAAAKLDHSAVATIRKLRGLASAYELAHLACVHPSTIDSIWKGETWRTA